MGLKKINNVYPSPGSHMVGDGFKVKSLIPHEKQAEVSPFLMFDYNEPWQLAPTTQPRGVDVHPHKGFETVTIAWQGSVAHKDSSGGKGVIGPGDVQWMTAGSGILHKEFHEENFSRQGGTFHMAQLWVNLPAKHKSTPPAYQDITADKIPTLTLPNEAGTLRVIAGTWEGHSGPARTFTRINLYDVQLQASKTTQLSFPEGDNLSIAVLSGHVLMNDTQVRAGNLVVFSPHNTQVVIEANSDSHLLVLGGEPINEPIAAYGPFVMNTRQEIMEAINDFNSGKFGHLS